MKISSCFHRLAATLHREFLIYYVVRSPGIFKWLQLKPTERVLDLGCGQGLWSPALALHTRATIGLDLRTDSIREAQFRLARQGCQNTTFVVASATDLPFAPDSFHKILCVDVLDTITDDQSAANEMARVLKPNGRLVITVLLKSRRHFLRTITFPEHLRNYTADALSTLLTTTGFMITGVFYFYHSISTLAWESLQTLRDAELTRIPGLGFLLNALFSTAARLDISLNQPGGGIGFAADKSTH